MNSKDYQKDLGTKPLPVIKKLYIKIFQTPPPSHYNKPQMIEKLANKFEELYADAPKFVNDEAEEVLVESPPVKPKKPNGKRKKKKGSRRGRIIEELFLGIWDTALLAEALNIENRDWKVPQNKAAIAGTLADLRNRHHLKFVVGQAKDQGRIFLDC